MSAHASHAFSTNTSARDCTDSEHLRSCLYQIYISGSLVEQKRLFRAGESWRGAFAAQGDKKLSCHNSQIDRATAAWVTFGQI